MLNIINVNGEPVRPSDRNYVKSFIENYHI